VPGPINSFEDGTIVAAIFNHPSHGQAEGDVSAGLAPTEADLEVARVQLLTNLHESMKVAAGTANDGSLIVLASAGEGSIFAERFSKPWANRFYRRCKTWKRSEAITLPRDWTTSFLSATSFPIGRKLLAAPFYHEQINFSAPRDPKAKRIGTSYLLFSRDDGLSWGDAVVNWRRRL